MPMTWLEGGDNDSRCQRTSSRTDAQHGIAVANPGELDQLRSDLATPSAYEALVRITG